MILLAKVCRERARARCCSRDGGGPSEVGLQEQASHSRKLRWSRAIVVSVMGKGVINHVMLRIRETNASEPLTKCRNSIGDIKTEGFRHFRDKSGGNLLIAQVVSGMKVA